MAPLRRQSCLPSCFSSSAVLDADGADDRTDDKRRAGTSQRKVSRLFSSLSSLRRKKKTVPIDAQEEIGDVSEVTGNSPVATKKKLTKDNKRRNNDTKNYDEHNLALSTTKNAVSGAPQKKPCVNHISTKCSTSTQVTSLHQILDEPMKTGTITSHTSSPIPTHIHIVSMTPSSLSYKSQKNSEEKLLDSNAGLVVLAMALAVLLLLGRASAIVCMSAWLYILPRLWLQAKAIPVVNSATKEASDHKSSEENKKRVVLQGLLERNKRKPPFLGIAPAS